MSHAMSEVIVPCRPHVHRFELPGGPPEVINRVSYAVSKTLTGRRR